MAKSKAKVGDEIELPRKHESATDTYRITRIEDGKVYVRKLGPEQPLGTDYMDRLH